MPAIIRKLLIIAAIDGLVLQPLGGHRPPAGPVKIDYQSHAIQKLSPDVDWGNDARALRSYGIAGLLKVASRGYLVAITQRKEVARLWDLPIYTVFDVSIVPVTSQAEAQAAIDHANELIKQRESLGKGTDGRGLQSPVLETDDPFDRASEIDDWAPHSASSVSDTVTRGPSHRRGSSVVEDVVSKRGAYGMFAENWFSRQGWRARIVRQPGNDTVGDIQAEVTKGNTASQDPVGATNDAARAADWPRVDPNAPSSTNSTQALVTSLLPKLLQTMKLMLASKTFYFAYDLDITRSLKAQARLPEKERKKIHSGIALSKLVDGRYFWNQALSADFVSAGHDDFVVPLMQGFVGQCEFRIESADHHESFNESAQVGDINVLREAESTNIGKEVLGATGHPSKPSQFYMTLISRRSTLRNGLRYLRRGVDENGNVANAVETEQVLHASNVTPDSKIYSFLQVRGSIPLFFSQTPYTFKPHPVLHGSSDSNQRAMVKHLEDLRQEYGELQAVSLIDRHGPELRLGEAYEQKIGMINRDRQGDSSPIAFEWFEFHKVCRGMKFENVYILVDSMADFLAKHGWTTYSSLSGLTSTQTGVIRTNCMDCLDRTNVVQSAFGQQVLSLQLASELSLPIELIQSSLSGYDTKAKINNLWADNGDAISLSYSGTAALKGDYTRTSKRTIFGLATDFSLTLSRYYHNLLNDFFAQACIDFLLGKASERVFAEFEAKMITADPAIDPVRARQSAIASAATVVIESPDEDLRSGWALATPLEQGQLRSLPFDEALLLITDAAVYAVRYDWDAEKPTQVQRIGLSQVARVSWGAYITETFAAEQMDTSKNVGVVIEYTVQPPKGGLVRVNSRALNNVRDAWSITGADGRFDTTSSSGQPEDGGGDEKPADALPLHRLAFKALPSKTSVIRGTERSEAAGRSMVSECDVVVQICEDIVRLAREAGNASLKVEEHDIISLAEAKRNTTLLEKMGYGLRRFVWG